MLPNSEHEDTFKLWRLRATPWRRQVLVDRLEDLGDVRFDFFGDTPAATFIARSDRVWGNLDTSEVEDPGHGLDVWMDYHKIQVTVEAAFQATSHGMTPEQRKLREFNIEPRGLKRPEFLDSENLE